MFKTIEPSLLEFVRISTNHFDESHNVEHAIKVTNTAVEIMEATRTDYEWDIVEYSCMLHDVCDHKYPESISKKELFEFIKQELGMDKAERIQRIIENTSYSKEANGLRLLLPQPDEQYSIALSDADRIEAIGLSGFRRCVQFTKAKGLPLSNVIEHCHEKLLRLYPAHFIKTKRGREIAHILHAELASHVDKIEKGIILL
jgi:uncharacterized protein